MGNITSHRPALLSTHPFSAQTTSISYAKTVRQIHDERNGIAPVVAARPYHYYTAEQLDQVVKLRKAGMTIAEISERTGVATPKVRDVCKSVRRDDLTEEQIAEIKRCKFVGIPCNAIARNMSLDRNRVAKVLRENT